MIFIVYKKNIHFCTAVKCMWMGMLIYVHVCSCKNYVEGGKKSDKSNNYQLSLQPKIKTIIQGWQSNEIIQSSLIEKCPCRIIQYIHHFHNL